MLDLPLQSSFNEPLLFPAPMDQAFPVPPLHALDMEGSSSGQTLDLDLDLDFTTDQSEASVADTIVRARKSWKTVKGRSEPVWPPHLERALIQGKDAHVLLLKICASQP